MRFHILTGGTLLALGILSAGPVLAQTQNSADALSGPLGAMTCADFVKMDTTAQADAIKQLDQTNGSLTSNSGAATSKDGSAAAATGAPTGAPLTAGELIAACQAGPSLSVHDAFAQFTSGSKSNTTTK
jgi:hypothetical protein